MIWKRNWTRISPLRMWVMLRSSKCVWKSQVLDLHWILRFQLVGVGLNSAECQMNGITLAV